METHEILFEEEIAGGKHWSLVIKRGMGMRLELAAQRYGVTNCELRP